MSGPDVASGYVVGTNGVRLWGLDGAERLARQLRSVGVTVVARAEDAPPTAGSVLLLRSDYLFEDRTIADLVRQPGVALTASGAVGAAAVVAAHVPARDVAVARAVLEGKADLQAVPDLVVRAPESLSTAFVRTLLKAAPPLVVPVRAECVAALERHLFDGSYKGVTDLVTKWVWPAPARVVTGICARLRVPPNVVTAASFALVVVATILFAERRFAAGLVVAWAMTFLDTVDGKLARVTVTSTRFGHYFDHSIDVVHPPIWYFAWAWGAMGGVPGIWTAAPLFTAMLVAYVAGRLIESAFEGVSGFSLFTWRPFDAYFRLILARRNPNLLLLTAAYVLGRPYAGFAVVAVWTVVSSLILTIRLLQGALARLRSIPLRPWLMDLGAAGGTTPWWASPFAADLAAMRHLVQ